MKLVDPVIEEYDLESLPHPSRRLIVDTVVWAEKTDQGWRFWYSNGERVSEQGQPFICGRLCFALWRHAVPLRFDSAFLQHVRTEAGEVAITRLRPDAWGFRALDHIPHQKYAVQRPLRLDEYLALAQTLATKLAQRRRG